MWPHPGVIAQKIRCLVQGTEFVPPSPTNKSMRKTNLNKSKAD